MSADDRHIDLLLNTPEGKAVLAVFRLSYHCGLLPKDFDGWVNFKQDLFRYILRHGPGFEFRTNYYHGKF